MNIIEMDSNGGRRITSSGQRELVHVVGRLVVFAPSLPTIHKSLFYDLLEEKSRVWDFLREFIPETKA